VRFVERHTGTNMEIHCHIIEFTTLLLITLRYIPILFPTSGTWGNIPILFTTLGITWGNIPILFPTSGITREIFPCYSQHWE